MPTDFWRDGINLTAATVAGLVGVPAIPRRDRLLPKLRSQFYTAILMR